MSSLPSGDSASLTQDIKAEVERLYSERVRQKQQIKSGFEKDLSSEVLNNLTPEEMNNRVNQQYNRRVEERQQQRERLQRERLQRERQQQRERLQRERLQQQEKQQIKNFLINSYKENNIRLTQEEIQIAVNRQYDNLHNRSQ